MDRVEPPASTVPADPAANARGGKRPLREAASPASFAADDPRPLYVYRRLLNAADLLDWARGQGFVSLVTADDLHVTIAYSRRPVNWFALDPYGSIRDELIVTPGGARMVEKMGDKGAVALCFASSDLQWRHKEMVDAGCSWDFASYIPHVTLSYDAGALDLAQVKPWPGRLVFGPEIFEPLDPAWTPATASAASFAINDGDDVDMIVDEMIAQDGFTVASAMTGPIVDRLLNAPDIDAARAILADALGAMDDAPLAQALERAGFAVRLDADTQPATDEGE